MLFRIYTSGDIQWMSHLDHQLIPPCWWGCMIKTTGKQLVTSYSSSFETSQGTPSDCLLMYPPSSSDFSAPFHAVVFSPWFYGILSCPCAAKCSFGVMIQKFVRVPGCESGSLKYARARPSSHSKGFVCI